MQEKYREAVYKIVTKALIDDIENMLWQLAEGRRIFLPSAPPIARGIRAESTPEVGPGSYNGSPGGGAVFGQQVEATDGAPKSGGELNTSQKPYMTRQNW